ncbi:MAG: adenylate/guanylate cyclase domain-containing protein [Lewinellaceae bacterium]|nr:adenylate/guanylate cyclase domain-containing protein [Lewinellaceae bacterium]
MAFLNTIRTNQKTLLEYQITGILMGLIYALGEYLTRINTDDPQAFVPLIIRGFFAGWLITLSVGIFEVLFKDKLMRRTFLFLVLVRAGSFTLIITFWLSVINAIWLTIDRDVQLTTGFFYYLTDISYLINLLTVLLGLLILIALRQINNLHRKGELWNFILGRYHRPREINRMFCFIDLKDSTTIAEQLGHLKFGLFLKDYYSDITDAIRQTKAEIYQYVGDEIILSWPLEKGLQSNNAVRCFFLMQDRIAALQEQYENRYGRYPQFKAGMHGGPVVVTWVGEVKKEIMYLGDVLNTASRIQESCKRLAKDFLISQDILDRLGNLDDIQATFVEETTPRGKERSVRVHSLERMP